MKKLVLILSCLFIALILNYNCTDSSNPTITDSKQAQQLQKPNKKKPPSEKPVIEEFKLIVNNNDERKIGIDPLPIVDFTQTNNYKFKYKVTHSNTEYRAYLKLRIHYMPVDYPGISTWYSSKIIENDEIIPGEEYYLEWNGGPTIVDPNDVTYYTSGDYKFMDQKAAENEDMTGIIEDEYFMYFVTDAEYKNDSDEDVPSEGEIKINALPGDGEIYVNSIDIIPVKINRKKYFPRVTILINDNSGGPCEGAQIMWNWGGNIIGDNYLRCCRITDANGRVIIDGPNYSTNKSGSIIFTLKRLSKVDNVYNPHSNSEELGDWPIEPSVTLLVN